jgi:hypothetical protein
MTRNTLHVLAAALCVAFSPFALSQPTGNPKGTSPPPSRGEAAKPPATHARPVAKEGAVSSDEAAAPDSRAARSGNLRTPGVGSPGGLAGRHPGQQPSGGTTETNQAPRPNR